MFLTFELPKRTFFSCDGSKISFIRKCVFPNFFFFFSNTGGGKVERSSQKLLLTFEHTSAIVFRDRKSFVAPDDKVDSSVRFRDIARVSGLSPP